MSSWLSAGQPGASQAWPAILLIPANCSGQTRSFSGGATGKPTIQGTFRAEERQTLSVFELSAWRERQQSIQRQRETKYAERHAEAVQQARQEWSSTRVCDANHPYLRHKGISALSSIQQATVRCSSPSGYRKQSAKPATHLPRWHKCLSAGTAVHLFPTG